MYIVLSCINNIYICICIYIYIYIYIYTYICLAKKAEIRPALGATGAPGTEVTSAGTEALQEAVLQSEPLALISALVTPEIDGLAVAMVAEEQQDILHMPGL
jgi:hypothetical protein